MTTQQTDQDALGEQVRARYAAAATKVTNGQGDCGCGQPADCGCDSGCCGGAATVEEPGFGAELYAALDRDQLPDTALLASLGCGNPTAVAELRPGETVLDLGSGGGIDVLLSAKRVGPSGKAYGLDMTEEMLALARANAAEGRCNQRQLPERPDRGHPSAGRDHRCGHLQLCGQPVGRQAGGVCRDLPRAQARRPPRHYRRGR
jgi:2-polyprenyl-3-methyl-5-hydroxy-6-metoxy-1,4-benzoquinol methylase